MNTQRLLALGFAFSMVGFGCVGAPDALPADEESTVDEVAARSWERFVGAWIGDSGPFHALVFTRTTEGRGHHYFADVDTGIRCVRAPCPSTARQEGPYSATTRTLTLAPQDARLGVVTPTFGGFQYRFQGTETLILSRSGREVARLHKAVSYCAEADDCHEQSLIVPRCLGRFTCQENTCRYVCGRPPPCAAVLCAPGTVCNDSDGTARCVSPCDTVRCGFGSRCVVSGGTARCVQPGATPCGTSICAVGTVCCNPLRGICTLPGQFCIQG
ncbi:MAG: hypothetical protein HY909_01325 [Deltaproteobacteria bacterium]|nr:hypothetical protein [Deltaproteobacteria bacterium]